jgi:Ca2+-binding EF-hand superfamily protein
MNSDFEPFKAFCHVDSRRIGRVDAHDLVDLLRRHYVAADLSEANDIIKEYNAGGDGALSFSDFS